MADAPPTEEGWFAVHDFREIDWEQWRNAPERRRDAALDEVTTFLSDAEDIGEGETAIFTVAGHEADILILHLRPTLDEVERLGRAFERTAFGSFTARTNSFVSVTEIGGYTSPEYFEDPEEVDAGLRRYLETKKRPSIPEDGYVTFYPMAKRRDPEYNWFETPMEERAEMMAEHGETGKSYAGTVTQVVTSAFGLDDWEWGVTLFATDAVALKDIVYEMRFDEATAKYGEFGSFFVGRRFPVDDLDAFMAAETVPVGADEADETDDEAPAVSGHPGGAHDNGDDDLREELADRDIYAGSPRGEDVYALALYSDADPETLSQEVTALRSNFEPCDTHVTTAVYEPRSDGHAAVVSVWETESAADTASGFLSDLPGIVGRASETEDGWATLGMFYTVDPGHRADFLETFDGVDELLADVDGHRESTLLVNREDETDMFIDSQWDGREHAMDFFRSDAFGETVATGRDVLTDRPRHVFLA
ncbi:heme-binding protein [Halanaeroarchaeum sulfurireducens]|uniref:Chlorite dismutase n=1 Tax=Halanaeroarchaeum sulfurireducens TaxID=1604004 RepID=A0A0N9N7K2_9EURY|nr:heme-binding protein [Halanaeroarchaeum sulfurireducens]ALG82832.1 chlorite dismutase [Halanaeroarchaeum sulfurireducens]